MTFISQHFKTYGREWRREKRERKGGGGREERERQRKGERERKEECEGGRKRGEEERIVEGRLQETRVPTFRFQW